MGKNVAVYVDVANIFYAAKAAGVDIDYVTLLKTASAGRDLVRAYAYTGLDPDNENQRNFHDFLRRHGYKVVSKDIRKYGDGKVKANLDIELVVDMMKTARNLDIAIVVSGDGDFAPAIRAVQEMGVRVEVISFRGNTSSDLIEVADQFTEITQIARVEKGSSRSGRRVAEDEDEDLSMTEVPDKQSEGTGRGRGRGRGRGKAAETEPVVATRSRSRSRVAAAPEEGAVAAITSGGTPLVVLPGEKLSRVAAVAPAALLPDDEAAEPQDGEASAEGDEDEPRRRRRRRGGRGRGRGRTRVDGLTPGEAVADGGPDGDADMDEDEEDESPAVAARPTRLPAPAKRVAQTFGSVWDSQIGVPVAASGATPGVPTPDLDDDDLDEPPIPEYLIAERRQRDGRGGAAGGRGGGGRGVRSGYSAAVDRERYGGAGRSGAGMATGGQGRPSRYAEPAPRGNREPDRFRQDRQDRPAPRLAPRGGSPDEPWSEVPPEIEAMLRAQLGSRSAAPRREAPAAAGRESAYAPAVEAAPNVASEAAPKRRTTRRTTAAKPVEAAAEPAASTAEAAPKRRTVRKPAAAKAAAAAAATSADAAPKHRVTRKPAATAAPAGETAVAAAPKRRTARKAAEPAE